MPSVGHRRAEHPHLRPMVNAPARPGGRADRRHCALRKCLGRITDRDGPVERQAPDRRYALVASGACSPARPQIIQIWLMPRPTAVGCRRASCVAGAGPRMSRITGYRTAGFTVHRQCVLSSLGEPYLGGGSTEQRRQLCRRPGPGTWGAAVRRPNRGARRRRTGSERRRGSAGAGVAP